MTQAPPPPVSDWLGVLDRIEYSLAQSLRLAPAPPDKGEPRPPADPLVELDGRLARWQACLDQAGANAATEDAQLAADEATLRDWLGLTSRARDLLAALTQ